MTTFNWKVQSVQHDIVGTDTGAITVACWECTGVDGEKTGSYSGATTFLPDVNAPGYVPYTEVTEEEVLAWLFNDDAKGNKRVDKVQVEASVQAQLDWVPTTASGVPWATTLES